MIYTTDTWRRALWSTIDTPNLGPCRRAYGNRLFFFWQMWILRISSASSDPLTQINDTHFKIIFHTLSIFWNICHFRTGTTNKTTHFYCYYIKYQHYHFSHKKWSIGFFVRIIIIVQPLYVVEGLCISVGDNVTAYTKRKGKGKQKEHMYSLRISKRSRLGQRHGLQNTTLTSYFLKKIFIEKWYT